MVKPIQQNNRELHQCEECGLRYAALERAEQCEAWCRAHKSCNLDFIKFAVMDDASHDL